MSDPTELIDFRTHGRAGPLVFVLHGGPAAAGDAAALAAGLADRRRAIEPWQRPSGPEPLTVGRHVSDLYALIDHLGADRPPLVGHSWGAMLALAAAAERPGRAGPLVLVGCGTFDPAARAQMRRRIDQRTTDDMRRRLAELQGRTADPGARLKAMYDVIRPVYEFEPLDLPGHEDAPAFDAEAHRQSWEDMLRLQRDNVYPQAFARIDSPVLMIHGDWDPHPGAMIRDGLREFIPHLQYRQLERCGHSPWRERRARDDFFRAVRAFLAETDGA